MKGRAPLYAAILAAGVAMLVRGHLPPGSAGLRDRRPAADADDRQLVGEGRLIYAAHCAACHGRALQGQPLWQVQDEDTPRRAPALDRFGPAWRETDAALFGIISAGRPPAMPAFGTMMSAHEMVAAIAFMKARWPMGVRVAQAMLNPGLAGMPRGAMGAGWTFLPVCPPLRD